MRLLLSLLPALACVLMLTIVCVPMMFRRRRSQQRPLEASTEVSDVATLRQKITSLQTEVAQLKEERKTEKR